MLRKAGRRSRGPWQGALHVARQAGQQEPGLIHISDIGVDPASPSLMFEPGVSGNLVKKCSWNNDPPSSVVSGRIISSSTHLRASHGDAGFPLFAMGRTKLRPVSMGNVAEACVRVLANPSTAGKIYELGGPRVYT